MRLNDLKYLAAFSLPLSALIGLVLQGYWSFFTPIFAFVIIPIIEIILPVNAENLDETAIAKKSKSSFFNWLLYANIPMVYGLVIWFLYTISATTYTSTYEIVGLTISIGIVVGANGINVAHELGHRRNQFEKTLGKLLLLPALYMHFYIEHNFGHHQNAATDEDPASAAYNQTVYSFWFTSAIRQYVSAWKLQLQLLKNMQKSFLSIKNDLLWYTLFQSLYLIIVFKLLGIFALGIAIGIAVMAVMLLETINYIEHYGLRRTKRASGRYERVTEIHSWNSNHVLGRVLLYELTRHSDHHYKAHKKYQLLAYHDSSPQMPYGYPTSMVLSLIPPLWFAIMNKRIPAEMKS